jgi:hypothetical protein
MKTKRTTTEGNPTGVTQEETTQEKTTQEKKNTNPTGILPITLSATYNGSK